MLETIYIAMLVLTVFSIILYFFQNRDDSPTVSYLGYPLMIVILLIVVALFSFNITVRDCVNQIDNQTAIDENNTIYTNTLTCEDTQIVEDDFGYVLGVIALIFFVFFVLRVLEYFKENVMR